LAQFTHELKFKNRGHKKKGNVQTEGHKKKGNIQTEVTKKKEIFKQVSKNGFRVFK